MGKIFNGQINLASTIHPTGSQPLDDRVVVASFDDLLNINTFGTAVYKGMLVVVSGTNNVYALVDETPFLNNGTVTADCWKPVSEGYGVITAENYSNALTLATDSNKGQIIFVLSEETIPDPENGDITYGSGLYVVVGNATLLKLAESSASGDIQEQVNNLTLRVTNIENSITLSGDDFVE